MERPTLFAEQHKHVLIGNAWLLCEVHGWRLVSSLASAVVNDGAWLGGTFEPYEVDQVRDYVDNFGNESFHKHVIQPFREAERMLLDGVSHDTSFACWS